MKRRFTSSARRAGLGLAATLAALAVAGPAQAAKVEVLGPNVFYNAGFGEDNKLEVSHENGYVWFHDAVNVTAGGGCAQSTAYSVRCPEIGISSIWVLAADGTNVVGMATALPTQIDGHGATKNTFHGGFGKDTISGGPNADELDGGTGDDAIDGAGGADRIGGGPGKDKLAGGEGNDQLDGGAGPDRFLGGDGRDRADYSSRTAPVAVSIGTQYVANDGEAGEGDNVTGDVEDLTGGQGEDVLLAAADNAANSFLGGGGGDRLAGGPGLDTLSGEAGADRIDGGAGGDSLFGGLDGDEIAGGSGADRLYGLEGSDLLDGGQGADELSGGDGEGDTVTYAAYTAPVFADLDGVQYDDGPVSEGDSISSNVERLVGGEAGDELTGNSAANRIQGGPGNDRIDGLAGSDELLGEAGDDDLRSVDGTTDTDDCGAGADVFAADPLDTLIGCEPKPAPGAKPGPVVQIRPSKLRLDRGGYARLRLTCPASASKRCVGTLRIERRSGGSTRKVASRAFSIAAGRTVAVKVRMPRGVRRAIARHAVTVTAVATARDAQSKQRSTRRSVTLRRARAS